MTLRLARLHQLDNSGLDSGTAPGLRAQRRVVEGPVESDVSTMLLHSIRTPAQHLPGTTNSWTGRQTRRAS
jgi:hypothetical protein